MEVSIINNCCYSILIKLIRPLFTQHFQTNLFILLKSLRHMLVFCFQNCSDLWWEKKIEIRGWRPKLCKMFEITRTIQSNSERSEQSLKRKYFLTCSWRFLSSNTLEQLKSKLEKEPIAKYWKSAGKVIKGISHYLGKIYHVR